MKTTNGRSAEERIEAARRLDAARKRHNIVQKEIPRRYQNSDEDQFPAIWSEIKTWRPNPEGIGLLLAGPKGTCKTRMICKLAIDMQEDGPILFAYERSSGLAKLVRRQNSFDEGAVNRIEYLHRVPVLILDDLGKQASSPTVDEEIFDLIDTRISEMLPTLISTNLVSAELEGSMRADRGGPLVRRIKEFSRTVIVR